MQKWNAEKGEYEPYSVPEGWDCPLFCADMQRVVNILDSADFDNMISENEIGEDCGLRESMCAISLIVDGKYRWW